MGVRRYQNPDGTLTAEGKERYSESDQKKIFENSTHGMIGTRMFSGDDPELKEFARFLGKAQRDLEKDVQDYQNQVVDVISNSWKDPEVKENALRTIGNPNDYDDDEYSALMAYEVIDYSCRKKIEEIRKPVQNKIDQYTKDVTEVTNDLVGKYGNVQVKDMNTYTKMMRSYRSAVEAFLETYSNNNSYFDADLADLGMEYANDAMIDAADNLIAELKRSYK